VRTTQTEWSVSLRPDTSAAARRASVRAAPGSAVVVAVHRLGPESWQGPIPTGVEYRIRSLKAESGAGLAAHLGARRARSRSTAAAEPRSVQRLRGAERRDSNPRPPGPPRPTRGTALLLIRVFRPDAGQVSEENWTPNGPRDGPVRRAPDVRNRGVCGGLVRSGDWIELATFRPPVRTQLSRRARALHACRAGSTKGPRARKQAAAPGQPASP
jgi:hypothetical protein